MARKGGNKKRCERYKSLGRLLINKKAKQEKHKKRMEKFAKKHEDGTAYEYVPNPYEKGTPEYWRERNRRAEKDHGSTQLPLSRLTSFYAKLNNFLKAQADAEKRAAKEKELRGRTSYNKKMYKAEDHDNRENATANELY